MKINLKCPCGAEFNYECADGRDVFIQPGGHPDSRGRVFAIQLQADDWITAHKDHKASPLREFFGPNTIG